MKKLGVYGGSFDPIHYGHLLLAEQCRESLELDQILFIPSAVGPFKQSGPQSSNRNRTEMLELAIAGHPHFEVSSVEIDRGGVSYTVDTLESLKQTYSSDTEFFLLMGADSVAGFGDWKSPDRICELAVPVVVQRPGSQVDLSPIKAIVDETRFGQVESCQFQSRKIEISSTEIRERVAQQKSIRFQTPRAVEAYIRDKNLYQQTSV